MNSLVKEIIQPLLEETTKVVALYPGKFKPPHRGHFNVASQLLDKADEVIVLISPVPVNGITAQQSEKIWNLYNTLLDNKLTIQIVEGSPVKYVLDTVKDNPDNNYIAAFGKGESERFKSIVGKPNVTVEDVGTTENLHATDFRKALASGQDVSNFIPKGIDKDEVLAVLTQLDEMSQLALKSVEDFADKELAPLDVTFTSHFFDRLIDPRNIKPISSAELIGFFKRLSRKKDQLIDFLKKYKEIVATDNRTNINIPLVKQANHAIAKTIMRKKDFLTPDPKIEFSENVNELQSQEIKYWALHSDIFDALKKDSDHKRVYIYLKNKLTGEKLKALEYFYNEYFLDPRAPIRESSNSLPSTFEEALQSLTQYMVDKGMNVEPLPKLIIINNDLKNAENILGKTAYYNPNDCSITLYTLNRHPKDILRSYSHEMIHRIQDNEGRLQNITTTNTNEEGALPELEKEAYLNGNMTFRNWEDSIKNPKHINEVYFLDIEKYNYPRTIHEDLWYTLNEIILNPNSAVEINGNLTRGKFQVGNIIYEYDIKIIPNPYNDGGNFANISFYPEGDKISIPTGTSTKENYIKILSTIYKIILNFVEEAEPDYVGISSMDNTSNKNYHMVYANLTDNKFNRIPGYFRKDVNLPFETPQGKGRMVVLKRKDV